MLVSRNGSGAPEREAGESARGVRADAGEFHQCGGVAWEFAVELADDHAGGISEAQGAVPVAESLPRTKEVGL